VHKTNEAGMDGTLMLENRGQLCYINVILQLLTHVMYFTKRSFGSSPVALWLETLMARKFGPKAGNKHIAMQETIRMVNANVPLDYKYAGQPNDANEMLCQLLSALHDDARVESIFGYKFLCIVECVECKVQSYTRQTTTQIEATDLSQINKLSDVFAKTFLRQNLSGDNAYACDTCRANANDPTKKTVAWRFLKTEKMPLMLTVQFLRFDGATDQKIMQRVSFPLDFKTDGGHVYRLFFVILHQGQSRQGGHYVSLGRLNASQFMKYNDAANNLVDLSIFNTDAVKQEVYMLFYQQI
jgi:ubiquitin C-terminal hydrolase